MSWQLPRRRFLLTTAGAAFGLTQLSRATTERVASAQSTDERPPLLRVLLRRDGRLDAATAQIAGDGRSWVRDPASDSALAELAANDLVTVGRSDGGLWFQVGDGKRRAATGERLQIVGDSGTRLSHVSGGGDPPPPYRGNFEAVSSGADGRVALLNVLGLDEYVGGVVPREMPVSFGVESARAQAVAARGFAAARRTNGPHQQLGADVCDGVDCQAYGGIGVEQPLSNAAVEATRGLVLSRGGKLVEPLYSSTCAGHTESIARLIGDTAWAAAKDGVADGEIPDNVDVAGEAGAATFYKGRWASNCASAPRYRWSVTWGRAELERILEISLRRLTASSWISPAFPADGTIGALTGLTAVERGPSGRVLTLRIEGTKGAWTVQRDWTIRNTLRTQAGDILPSSAFVLEMATGGDGKLGPITAFGGGWGHGVGMCQWGTRGLSEKGLAYDAILGHYFPETELTRVSSQ